ncbi:MAG: toll/interleukin-1 receptor domain-containing protein [Nitrosomonadales bacterium]|nr:toll/interleukin-1 receptor domain-containing protein [Nitrosomonadales bacterium]
MSFANPVQNLTLLYAIQKRLNEMFAGSTGFSGPEMVEYFSRHDVNVEPYSWRGGMPGRKQIFEDCLARFSFDRQLEIITDLLTIHHFVKYSPPQEQDRQFIREWLSSQDMPARQPIHPTMPQSPQLIQPSTQNWDVFISHASEDKESFVRPLANALIEDGIKVWFDEFTLTLGDSLRRKIDRGLAASRFGIVVLSPAFFQKEWPQRELDGLVARESNGQKVILPIWHNIGHDEIAAYSPMLADRLAASSSRGLPFVVARVLEVLSQR